MDSALFKDKVYLVTGGAGGIGLACVHHLLKHDAYVYTIDIQSSPSTALTEISTPRLTYHQCDISNRARCHEIVSEIISKHGRLDGLVNNAGIAPIEGELTSDELFNSISEVNIKGVFNMSAEALVQMKKQGSGSIVSIGSISAVAGKARLAVYAASKHAVLGLTRSWALDYAKYGVRVNMVSPGTTDTPMARGPIKVVMGPVYGADKTEEELLAMVVKNIPMGRIGLPDDIANAVDFFLSDLSSYVTGQCLCVAGGMV